jgi:hypothetical protein
MLKNENIKIKKQIDYNIVGKNLLKTIDYALYYKRRKKKNNQRFSSLQQRFFNKYKPDS